MTWLELRDFLNDSSNKIDWNKSVEVYDADRDSYHSCDTYIMPSDDENPEMLVLGINFPKEY